MRRVWILGSGKRVQDAAIPAIRRATGFTLQGVLARTAKTITVEGEDVHVTPLADLKSEELQPGDLIFSAVAKVAVPDVLATLGKLGVGEVDLMIDTPVLLYKHMGCLPLLDPFRNVWVSEDTTTLPCWDPVRASIAAGDIGEVRRVVLDRSGYAYHAFAMGKAVFGNSFVRAAKRWKSEKRRGAHFMSGGELEIRDPRDYSIGRIRIEGTTAAISDSPDKSEHLLQAIIVNGECTGFRVGAHESLLSDVERTLMGGPKGVPTAGVTVWMEGQKRVGFLRLLNAINSDAGAYPLEQAIDDTVADYHLERVGRYAPNPFTSPRSGLGRFLLRVLTKLARR